MLSKNHVSGELYRARTIERRFVMNFRQYPTIALRHARRIVSIGLQQGTIPMRHACDTAQTALNTDLR